MSFIPILTCRRREKVFAELLPAAAFNTGEVWELNQHDSVPFECSTKNYEEAISKFSSTLNAKHTKKGRHRNKPETNPWLLATYRIQQTRSSICRGQLHWSSCQPKPWLVSSPSLLARLQSSDVAKMEKTFTYLTSKCSHMITSYANITLNYCN